MGRETEEGDKTFGATESLKSISTVTKVNKQTQPAAAVSLPIARLQTPARTHNPHTHARLLSLFPSPSHPTGRRGSSGEHDAARLQVTDMSHHLKPCGTIIPLSL